MRVGQTGPRPQTKAAGRPQRRLSLALCAAPLVLAGCWGQGPTDLQRQLQLRDETIAHQKDELEARQATIAGLQKQVDEIRAIGPEDLRKIFYPQSLEIDKLSGGYDTDNRPGDEGVVVYLKPIDQQGDVLKAAGDIRIQLYDLAADPTDTFVGEYVIPIERARELWYGKLLTYYYAVKCPWLRGPPKHSELTIRATFTDYLTQRVVSAQRTCNVTLPP